MDGNDNISLEGKSLWAARPGWGTEEEFPWVCPNKSSCPGALSCRISAPSRGFQGVFVFCFLSFCFLFHSRFCHQTSPGRARAALTESYNSRASQHQRNSEPWGLKTSQMQFIDKFLSISKASQPSLSKGPLHEASAPRFGSGPAPISAFFAEFQGVFLLNFRGFFVVFCCNLKIWQQISPQEQHHLLRSKRIPGEIPTVNPPIGRELQERAWNPHSEQNSWISDHCLCLPASGIGLKSWHLIFYCRDFEDFHLYAPTQIQVGLESQLILLS